MSPRVMVAGVGNIFFADDGFGVEVAKQLAQQTWPDWVSVADFGIRGVHLAYQLAEGYDTLILVDAVSRREAPGTVMVLEPDFGRDDLEREDNGYFVDAHGMDPEVVLGMVKNLGGKLRNVVIVGCEPAEVVERIGLSDVVAQAVPAAVGAVREIVDRMQCNGQSS